MKQWVIPNKWFPPMLHLSDRLKRDHFLYLLFFNPPQPPIFLCPVSPLPQSGVVRQHYCVPYDRGKCFFLKAQREDAMDIPLPSIAKHLLLGPICSVFHKNVAYKITLNQHNHVKLCLTAELFPPKNCVKSRKIVYRTFVRQLFVGRIIPNHVKEQKSRKIMK